MEPLKMAASLRVRRCRRFVVAGEYSEAAADCDHAAVRFSPVHSRLQVESAC